MFNAYAYRVILEAKGNKFLIYYDNSAIYCKALDFDGDTKETILIDSVYDSFFCAKSQEDDIYLLCQGRNKTFLLLTFDGEGWNMEELSLRKDFGSIIPMGLFALTDGIHIVYAKKLSLDYYYDLFQLRRTKDGWEKNFISEIYLKAMEFSIDIKSTGFDMLHLVSTLYDGETSSLNYCNYNAKSGKWIKTPIINLNRNNIYIKMLIHENNLNLFCYSLDNNMLNLFYFTKQLRRESIFLLIDIIKLNIVSKDSYMVMELNDDILKICYADSEYYYENNYNVFLKQWEKYDQIPLNQLPNLYIVKEIKDNFDLGIDSRETICSIDDKLEILYPCNESMVIEEDKSNDNIISPGRASMILDQMDLLTEKVEILNRKINKLEEKDTYKEAMPRKERMNETSHKYSAPTLKQSNFRENFMKSSPTSIKLNHSPLLSGVESEKPMIIEESKEKNEVSSEEYPNKPKGFIRALTEWFK
ncbi:hypothetical protein [Lutispora saccharofermentans]|uniref:Uncharacterized protein n=1 Tax=Lutispora saccharofermentans TaxID=3024236 RepID=A0ABT1NEU3_9FIRM|nr:hypothetical protein [Lutispora saccharofermentans]MCQ1529772.1 hypothetical protein [Lutispora saccharofermentans]